MVGPCPQHRGARAPKLRGTNEEYSITRAARYGAGRGRAWALGAAGGIAPHWHLPARADRSGKGIVGIDSNAEPGGSTARAA